MTDEYILSDDEREALREALFESASEVDTSEPMVAAVERIVAARVAAAVEQARAATEDAERKASDLFDAGIQAKRRTAEWQARAEAAEAERDRLRAAVTVAVAMSDYEPTNRVWHEQMQRIRAALAAAPAPRPEAKSYWSDTVTVDQPRP